MDSLSIAVGLGAIWERHLTAIRRWGERRVSTWGDPAFSLDDFCQEVFLRMRSRFEAFDGESVPERVWVYRQARDAFVDLCRRMNRGIRNPERVCHIESWVDGGVVSQLAASFTGVLTHVARQDAAERVVAILEKLEAIDREVIIMRDLDELTFEEIGTLLDTSAQNARVRHFRAMQRLRRLWKKEFPDSEVGSGEVTPE